jgi:YVTN family beta-propeller protein
VFVAHTSRNRLEVIDADRARHVQSLEGFAEAAGVVAADATVLVTNRGAASVAVLDAHALQLRRTIATGPRPNGVALDILRKRAAVACLGDDATPPALQFVHLDGGTTDTLNLPGRPRWCVFGPSGSRVYCAIRDPSLVMVAAGDPLREVDRWPLPDAGAHGLDLDADAGRLYVGCDAGALVQVELASGAVTGRWPLPGLPDAIFFNPASGLVHAAIGDPGVVVSIEPRTGRRSSVATARGAKTSALVPPNRLYVFAQALGGALDLEESRQPATVT